MRTGCGISELGCGISVLGCGIVQTGCGVDQKLARAGLQARVRFPPGTTPSVKQEIIITQTQKKLPIRGDTQETSNENFSCNIHIVTVIVTV